MGSADLRALVLSSLGIILVSARVATAQPLDDNYVNTALKQWGVPGVAIAIVQSDKTIARGYGVLRLGALDPVDADTIFPIGSDSKAFTSAAFAMLVSEGKLQWDDPVTRHLPQFQMADPWVTREATMRDVLGHRTGLGSFRGDNLWYRSPYPREEVVRRLRFLAAAGSFRTYGYSNVMYIVAGQVLAAASGSGWDQFIQTRIFQPLGMSRSSTSFDALRAATNVASPHEMRGAALEAVAHLNVDNAGPASSINSTAKDLLAWLRLQLGDGSFEGRRLLSAASLRQTQTPQVVIPGRPDEKLFPHSEFRMYGLGWVVQDFRGRRAVWHNGGVGGMKTTIVLVPQAKLAIAVLANRADVALTDALAWRWVDAALGGELRDWSAEWLAVEQAAHASAAAASERQASQRIRDTRPSHGLEAFVGTYVDQAYGQASVVLKEGRLAIASDLDIKGMLDHWHFDTFRYSEGGNFVQFFTDNAGSIAEFRIGPMTFRRTR